MDLTCNELFPSLPAPQRVNVSLSWKPKESVSTKQSSPVDTNKMTDRFDIPLVQQVTCFSLISKQIGQETIRVFRVRDMQEHYE